MSMRREISWNCNSPANIRPCSDSEKKRLPISGTHDLFPPSATANRLSATSSFPSTLSRRSDLIRRRGVNPLPAMRQQIIPARFFQRDPVICARELVGNELIWGKCSGIVVETEAYLAENDEACHTFS